MKIKKTLLAGATAATLALAGTSVAVAQENDGSSDLPGVLSSSSEGSSNEDGEGSAEGSLDGIAGSLEDAATEDGILGSVMGEEDETWWDAIGNIGGIASAIAGIVGLISAITALG